jgi:SAM-dependent methyltransferase
MDMRSALHFYTDGGYLANRPDWHVQDSAWKADNIYRILSQGKITFGSCVEVGCGAGQILGNLAGYYPDTEFVGYDISPELKSFWEGLNCARLTFVLRDFAETSEVYDLLLLIDVFEHVEDYLSFLKSIATRAHWFVFHIPLDMNVQNLLRDKQINLRDEVGHLHYFSAATAIRTLEDAGYEANKWFYTATSQEAGISKRTIKSRVLNVFRRALFRFAPNFVVKVLGGYSLMVLARANRRVDGA